MPPRKKVTAPSLSLSDLHSFATNFTGLSVPDPITFIISPKWLDRGAQLYPRQATLLKIINLRDDLFTNYDLMVIDEWETSYRNTGNNGIVPGIRDRITILKEAGYKWFREVLLVMGRRAGKGHISGLAMSYVLWNYMSKGDPQAHYGIDRDKKLTCLIYAGKKEQARENLWRDLVNFIIGGPCFEPYIHRPLGESLSVFAPHDVVRIRKLGKMNNESNLDMATFKIEPKEATLMSGRGSASFMQGFDEMAHVVASGANRSAEEIYAASTPALDQFKKDAFIVEPSSPWQMTGQFYENYQKVLAIAPDGDPLYPNMMMIQLTSWDIYKDWEIADQIDLFPREFKGDLNEYLDEPLPKLKPLKGAIQEYDEAMRLLEQSNPDTFKVERLSQWQATMDAYLDKDKIEGMWKLGEQLDLNNNKKKGKLNQFYTAHADPSSTNANFGLSVAHTEMDPNGSGMLICVFDYIHHWSPADFPEHTIDYIDVIDQMWSIMEDYPVDEFTTDQFSSGPIRSMLMHKANDARMSNRLHKEIKVSEANANANSNWRKAENFKVALYQGWIAAPFYEQADLELKFLKLIATATTMRVDKQDSGPVTTKDVADTMFQVVHALLGDQIEAMRNGFNSNPIVGGLPGGIVPFAKVNDKDAAIFSQLGGRHSAGRLQDQRINNGSLDPSRSGRIYRDPSYHRTF